MLGLRAIIEETRRKYSTSTVMDLLSTNFVTVPYPPYPFPALCFLMGLATLGMNGDKPFEIYGYEWAALI